MKKILVLLSLALSVALLGPAPAAQADHALDIYDCADFDRYGDTRWLKAQQHYRWTDRGLSGTDPNHLDGDRDGYACEDLALKTPVVGKEPGCYRKWLSITKVWRKDCSGRDLYRAVYWLTTLKDQRATQGALLDVYGPRAAKHEIVKQMLTDAYDWAGSDQKVNGCMRDHMLEFVGVTTDAKNASQTFVDLLGTGDQARIKVANKRLKVSFPNVYGVYAGLGGKVMTAATEVALNGAAINSAAGAATCF